MSRKITRAVLLLIVAFCAATALAGSEDPITARGFNPETLYQFGNLDNINLFNGNLLVAMPIGQTYTISPQLSTQLMLSYNSKVWDLTLREYGTGAFCTNPLGYFFIPNRKSNAGMGWSLGFGRLFPACHPSNEGHDVAYLTLESPDGGSHAFTRSEDAGDTWYTTDGSHLRVRDFNTSIVEVDFPDGSTYTFKKGGTGHECDEYLLDTIADGFQNTITVSWVNNGYDEKLTDPYGRETVIHYSDALDNDAYDRVITSVVFPAFHDETATYTFHYVYPTLDVPSATADCEPSTFVTPVLESVERPDHSTFKFEYGYLGPTTDHVGSQLVTMVLPTKGKIQWEFEGWELPSTTCELGSPWSNAVKSRKFIDPVTGATDEWKYTSEIDAGPFDSDPNYCNPITPYPLTYGQWPKEQKRTTVIDPRGDKSVHYFSVWQGRGPNDSDPNPAISPHNYDSKDYGLSLTKLVPAVASGAFLSSQRYDCGGTGDCSAATPERSTYVLYEHHRPAGVPAALPDPYDLTTKTTRTVFEKDKIGNVPRYIENESSDYDGFGHYRVVKTTGNLGPNGAVQTRTVTTNYNGTDADVGDPATNTHVRPGTGTWPDITPIDTDDRWILNTYPSITVEEDGHTSKQLFFFDRWTGFLSRTRVRRGTLQTDGFFSDGSDRRDLLTVFEPSTRSNLIRAEGEIASETHYGGDVNLLPDSSAALADLDLGTATGVRIDHTYKYGTRETSTIAGAAYPTMNLVIDKNTGYPSSATDPAGHVRSVAFDSMSRISKMTLPSGTVTDYGYPITDRAYATSNTHAANSTVKLLFSTYAFDGFGRLASVRDLTAKENVERERTTTWNGLGQKVSETAPEIAGTAGATTTYTFDAFGQPLSVIPPDGETHGMYYGYTGSRITTVTRGKTTGGIGMSLDSGGNVVEQPALVSTQEFDSFGRLAKAIEYGAGGAETTASYAYDIGGRLKSATIAAPEATQSPRTFVYDNRGFIVSQTQPENGTTSFKDYDVFGHATRRVVGDEGGLFDLTFVYDIYQRLTEIRQGSNVLKKITFDSLEAGDPKGSYSELGKVVKTYRRNDHTELGGDVAVNTYLTYDSVGRLNDKTTVIGNGPSFVQTYHYDALDALESLDYPTCTGCSPLAAGASIPQRTISFAWSHGYLTGVDEGANHFTSPTTPIEYWPNGLLKTLTHVAKDGTHEVTDSWTLDHGMARPENITFSGVAEPPCVPPGSAITASAIVGGQTAAASVLPVTGATYLWSVQGATMTSGNSSSSITFVPSCNATNVTIGVAVTTCETRSSSLVLSIAKTPTIVTPPHDALAEPGQSVKLSVVATGNPTYQWHKGHVGASTNVGSGNEYLDTDPLALGETATYWVTVTGGCGSSVNSPEVTVTATGCEPIQITGQPISVFDVRASSAEWVTLGVTVTGTSPQYQWYELKYGELVPVTDGTNPVLKVNNLKMSAIYKVKVWNSCSGPVESSYATVHVTSCGEVSITAQPADQRVVEGQSATLDISATVPLLQQHTWYYGTTGDTSHVAKNTYNSQYTTLPLTEDTDFWVRIVSTNCSVDSRTVHVSVCHPPKTFQVTPPKVLTPGESFEFGVYATGSSLHYQWYMGPVSDPVGSTPIGYDARTVTTSVTHSTTIWARVTGECGTADTAGIPVTYCVPPAFTSVPNDQIIVYGSQPTMTVAVDQTNVHFNWYYKAAGSEEWIEFGGDSTSVQLPVIPGGMASMRVLVHNALCSAYSRTVSLDICVPPPIWNLAGSIYSTAGETVVLTSATDQLESAMYSWYQGEVGDTSHFLGGVQNKAVNPDTTTNYWLEISNGRCATRSGVQTVYVCRPRFATQPVSQTFVQGVNTNVHLTFDARGTLPMAYQWYTGATGDKSHPIAGQTSTDLIVTPTATTSYWAEATCACPLTPTPAQSATAVVTYCVPPAAPATVPVNITYGDPAVLTVTPTAGTNLQYRWYQGSLGDMSFPLVGSGPQIIIPALNSVPHYWAHVTGDCGTADVAFDVNVCYPPAITQQPASVTIGDGLTTTLSVASSASGVTYQWYEGMSPDMSDAIAGATAATYTTPALTATANYWVLVTAGGCSAKSGTATVTVCMRPTITAQPIGRNSGTAGAGVTLSVQADPSTAGDSLTYDWYYGAPGDTSQVLALNAMSSVNVAPFTTTSYWCRVTEGACYRDSNAAIVEICVPYIYQQPQDASITQGNPVTLSVAANGTAPMTYQWYTGTSGNTSAPINGATGSTVTVTPSGTSTYWVQVKSPCNTTTAGAASRTATVTVCIPAHVTTNPSNVNINLGQSATLSVAATGTNLHYAWYTGAVGNTANPLSSTTSSVTFMPTSTTQVWARVTADCGAASDSTAATVTVCIPPSITQQPADSTIPDGSTATLTVATNATGVTYQWYRGTAPDTSQPVGTNAASFTTPALTTATSYWVRLTAGCSTNSATATVNICTRPTITSQPFNQNNVAAGSVVNLAVVASPANPNDTLTYDWYVGASGNTSQPMYLNATNSVNVVPFTTTSYWVRVSGGGCYRDSATAVVDVCIPKINTQPQDASIVQGNNVTLSVVANGTATMTYQWYTGTSGNTSAPINGATGSSVTVAPAGTTTYWVQIKSPCSTTSSGVASRTTTVTVCIPAQVTTNPSNVNVNYGQSATLTVAASGTNPHYAWYTGAVGNTTSPLSSTTSSVTFTPSNTTTVWARVTGDCGAPSDSTAATVDVCISPTITTQPTDRTIPSGTTTTFTVVASGTTLTYQWYRGENTDTSTPITGATSASYTTPALTSDTRYWCNVTSKGRCSTRSASALAAMCVPPAVSISPQSAGIASGQTVTLSVPAGYASYAWYSGTSGNTSSGVIGTSYYKDVAPTSTTSYWVRVGNGICSSDSAAVTVQVCIPNITAQPTSRTIAQTTSTTLSVTANGASSYQWYIGNSGTTTQAISNATGSSVTVTPGSTTSYWVRANGSCGSVNSQTATVTVTPCTQPTIQNQPQPVTFQQGSSATLSVGATGTNLTYQWYKSDPAGAAYVAAGTTSSITVAPTGSQSYFYVVVSNACGTRQSNTVTVTKVTCIAPSITQQPVNYTFQQGSAATFSVGATGTNLHYQWYKSDPAGATYVAVTGGTASTLTIVPASTQAYYYVRITGDCGTAINSNAVVATQACDPITIYSEPQSTTINAGEMILLGVDAGGTNPQYGWMESTDGNHYNYISGSPGVYVAPGVTSYYYCFVSNDCSNAQTNIISVTVVGGGGAMINEQPAATTRPRGSSDAASVSVSAPRIAAQPLSQTIAPHGTATLSLAADSGSVQWFAATDGGEYQAIPGATDAILTVSPAQRTYYFARVTNVWAALNSQVATISVAPAVSATPVYQSITREVVFSAGSTATLEVRASGSDLHYQWFKSDPAGSPLAKVGTDSPRLTDTPAGTEALYEVRITNDAGFIDTELIVARSASCAAPSITAQPHAASVRRGQSATLQVGASAAGAVTYEWFVTEANQRAWVPVAGENKPVLTVAPDDTRFYYCLITSACGAAVTSNSAVVEVTP